jgi:acetolactate decarboxylase
MPELKCTLSTGVWGLLQGHSKRACEPLGHIVNKALIAYFDVAHHTIYQVSTATPLIEATYRGAARVGTLREHGDLGLGPFEDLDDEVVTVDGHFFQVRCGVPADYRDNHQLMEIVHTRGLNQGKKQGETEWRF